jgi:hypothetical protein
MIDPRIAWFAIGATSGLVLAGWPWHPRFSRFNRMGPPRGSYGSRHPQGLPPPPPAPGFRRVFFDMPVQVAECGGPCEAGPEHCDCGALWRDEQIRLDPGSVRRGNGSGGPTTPKPGIVPKPQPPLTQP